MTYTLCGLATHYLVNICQSYLPIVIVLQWCWYWTSGQENVRENSLNLSSKIVTYTLCRLNPHYLVQCHPHICQSYSCCRSKYCNCYWTTGTLTVTNKLSKIDTANHHRLVHWSSLIFLAHTPSNSKQLQDHSNGDKKVMGERNFWKSGWTVVLGSWSQNHLKTLRCYGSEVSTRGLPSFCATQPPSPVWSSKYIQVLRLCQSP